MNMRLKLIALFIVLSPWCANAEENLFSNSGMDTAGAWKGDRAFVDLSGNKVLAVKAKKRGTAEFYQDASTRGINNVILTFKYMSKDYKGEGLQVSGERIDGSTYRNSDINADGQWHTYEWDFSEVRDNNKLTFQFRVYEGEGTVYFDDVVLKPKTKK